MKIWGISESSVIIGEGTRLSANCVGDEEIVRNVSTLALTAKQSAVSNKFTVGIDFSIQPQSRRYEQEKWTHIAMGRP